jgi:hypothetical protein
VKGQIVICWSYFRVPWVENRVIACRMTLQNVCLLSKGNGAYIPDPCLLKCIIKRLVRKFGAKDSMP